MENPKMPSPPTSTQEQLQDGLSGGSYAKASADQSKMNEVNRSLGTTDSSSVLIGSVEANGSKKPNLEDKRDRVYSSLRAIVNEVASQLRKSLDEVLHPDPISYCLPENYGGINALNTEAQSSPSSSAETKTSAKSTLVGEETVSFILPPDCQVGTDSNKNIQHQSSFEERLRGWHIEWARRANGKLDLFYRHGHSRRMFRSTVEVVEFIMEAFIAKETSGNHSVQKQGPTIVDTDVKRFLEESYDNLRNFCSGSGVQESEHEREQSLKLNSENKGGAFTDE